MQRIAAEDSGIVIVLRQEESARSIMDAVAALQHGRDIAVASAPAGGTVLRTYGIGAQILKDLGVTRMRVLSSPKQMLGISAFDLEVTDYVD
jgi:3,4-dihydroxy 2-butanone 4-phosphate synthase/GTP cyclohydrolase II